MQAQTCPVCQGTGDKTVGFYTQASIRDGTPTKCRSCDGKGYVVIGSDPTHVPMPDAITPVGTTTVGGSIGKSGPWDVRYGGPPRIDTAGKITGKGEVLLS